MRLLPYSLQKRFLVGLILIVLVTGTFFVLVLRMHMNELFLSEAQSKANLMVAHVESIQHYVRSVLRPITSKLIGSDEFIIEAMSTSYVSRRILSGLNFAEDEFTYRRVAKNARNPDFEVNEREAVFFNIFQEDPKLKSKETVVSLGGKKHLVVARPVYFTESCMRCHGDPADAPAVLLSMYDNKRGFYREPGELCGLDIISVPMESATGAIGKSITVFAVCFAGGMLILLLSVQGFFNRLVVHNLRRVGHILQQKFPQEETRAVLAPLRKQTEIEGMIQSIEAVASHLSEARGQLSDYAKNLEVMVKDRTADLKAVLDARSADVRVFMRLLSDLNNAQDKRTLLRTSLGLLARHFAADRAVYVCGLSGLDRMDWPDDGPAPGPEKCEQLQEQLIIGEPAMRGQAWYIPVQSAGQTRGMLALYWNERAEACERAESPGSGIFDASGLPKSTYFPLAMSLGRQLGIALDNLDALDVLLRQNSLLDSIVEGVSDPLILVERGTVPVLANSSARELAARLLSGDQGQGESCGLLTANDFSPAGVSKQGDACLTALLALMGVTDPPLHSQPAQREVLLADGGSFAVGIHLIQDSGSGRSGIPRAVVHLRETTEEKRILSHMRQSEKLAAVGQLAAGLAHEINNPLGVIRCYAELLDAAGLDEQSQADLKIILRHVEQAQSVLRDMLDFSRSRESCPEPCDIRELLQGLMDIFRPQARSARVECRLELDESLPALLVDKGLLEQVIVNLLLNALDAVKKYRPGEGLVTLRAAYDAASNQAVITVLDNGPGIPEELLSKIFDPFFTTKDPGTGTGLGLTIAFGMVSDMQGRLEVESPAESGHGTALRITLPVTGPQDRPAIRPEADANIDLSHD